MQQVEIVVQKGEGVAAREVMMVTASIKAVGLETKKNKNDKKGEDVEPELTTDIGGVGASVATGNTGSNGSSSNAAHNRSSDGNSSSEDENDPKDSTRKSYPTDSSGRRSTTNETVTMVSYGICCTYALVFCWTTHALVENYILVRLGRLAMKSP
jgi:hypothetical protein